MKKLKKVIQEHYLKKVKIDLLKGTAVISRNPKYPWSVPIASMKLK